MTALYQSWYSVMVRFASRLTGNVEIAEEIVQEYVWDHRLARVRDSSGHLDRLSKGNSC